MCTVPPLLKQDPQMTYPGFKPTVEQLSLKEMKSSLLDKMECSPNKELEDIKIEPKQKVEEVRVEMFNDPDKADTMMEYLATKNKLLHDMISQLEEKIAEKDELLVKYQYRCGELQKGTHRSSGKFKQ